ncbi:MAG: DMT family transporter [Candidatus Nanopelagicales bacterium]
MSPGQLRRPARAEVGILAVAVLAISTSGPIIAACAAPALAIAFWRTALGGALTAFWMHGRHPGEWARLTARSRWLMVAAGLALGAHFAAWVPSLRFTSVASSTALVATQPVWAALIAQWRGVRIPRQAWLGTGVSVAGVLVLTGVDFTLARRSLIGDGLALAGAVLAAVYVSLGERVRRSVSTATYTTVGYLVAALALVPLLVVLRVPLIGYSARDWLLILALTGGAQLLGHTLVNRVLASMSATVVSLAILFEMPGSTLIAAGWLGQVPPLAIIPAVGLLFAGLGLVIRAGASPAESGGR